MSSNSQSQSSQPTSPRRCAGGCGFFGSPENKFLCSKCYTEYLKEEINKLAAAVTLTSPPRDSSDSPAESAAAPAKSKRCFCCNKKVGLMSFGCRCGGTFCGPHRFPEEHKCGFDFKALGRKPTSPRKCARGCDFFGSPENNFLCSKCYTDYLKEEITKLAAAVTLTLPPPQDSSDLVAESAAAPAKSKRCLCCNKKVGLMSFGCRCGGTFCGSHRFPEEHKCGFDFKALGRKVLAKENPAITHDKFPDRI
nr:putative zinc finger A20 and AN1 domain-containing stress-associated protein 8 [Ipomoea batatas]